MKILIFVISGLISLGSVSLAAEADVAKQYFALIRSNDLGGLKAMLAQGKDVNARGDREATPLIYASAFGSAEALRMLLEAKADVNASNALGMTALHFSVTEPDKARLLVEHGANVNAKTKTGRTPLIVAGFQNHSDAVVQLLIAKGADVLAADKDGNTFLLAASGALNPEEVKLAVARSADVNGKDSSGTTALINAATAGDLESVRFLIAKGADVNAATKREAAGAVKNGKIDLGEMTALMMAAPWGPSSIVEALLRAGARVNVQDQRGFTALTYAVTTEHQDPAIVALLLKAGAKPDIRARNGETPAAWAQKFSNPAVTQMLRVSAAGSTAAVETLNGVPNSRVAVEKGLKLLDKISDSFLNTGGCVSCHAQNLNAFVSGVAREHAFPVDSGKLAGGGIGVKAFVSGQRDGLLMRQDPPGGVDTILYMLLHLSSAGTEADIKTDAMVHNVAAQQLSDGSWHVGGFGRPPMEDSDIARTALAIRAFQKFGWEGRRADLDRRSKLAQTWLVHAKPMGSEDYSMQLLGMKWSAASDEVIQQATRRILAQQRADGGWGQNPNLPSDAYATGQILYALAENKGMSTSGSAFQHGVQFLLKTQHEDGSWHVRSRSMPFQPYFQSGFPYDQDQWISMAGTAWATAALAVASEPASVAER